MRRLWMVCGLALLAAAGAARADDWAAPTTKYVKSDSGRYRAVLVPGEAKKPGTLTLYDDKDPVHPKRMYQRKLVNQVAPVRILVADGGQLATVDEWGNAGYKHALVIYDKKGKVVVDCALEHLLLPEELAAVDTTTSSRWWRAKEEGDVWLDASAVLIKTAAGPVMRVELASGTQTRDGRRVAIPGSDRCRATRK